MSETAFPINDLLRRKFQTALLVISLTLCVASTLFLLLFSEKIGFGISLMIEGKLSAGFSTVFSNFILFVGFLVFVVGIVVVSFFAFVMMVQRVKDIGLIKAAGCPNDMIFGYFMMELLLVAFVGCFLGVIFGIIADFVSTAAFNSVGLQTGQGQLGFWLVPIVFGTFFALTLVLGVRPVLKAAKVETAKALSPSYYFGLTKEGGFGVGSKSGLNVKIALRSLARHKSATFRIVICLAVVFLLATVGIAGGLIADSTTKSWIEKATGRDITLIAHSDMYNQYTRLQEKFSETSESIPFDYVDEQYLASEEMLSQLANMSEIQVDARLILEMNITEIPGIIIDEETGNYTTVGDYQRGVSLVVGVEPTKVLSDWFLEGESLKENSILEAVIGDSLALQMFTMPLEQSVSVDSIYFDVIGVCIDPINNGNVTYIPITDLQMITGVKRTNVIMVKVEPSANHTQIINQLRTAIKSINSDFDVFDLNEVLDKNLGFIGFLWSTIMFLPLLSLFAAFLCLVAYVALTINEQRQELGVLRALGARPATIVRIVSLQNLVVLISSYAAGVAFGIIITLLILVPDPVIAVYTVMEIAGWLLVALAATFIFGLYPAIRFARKPILEIMA
ncbi:FtsX-like permease family protein [Candidatus Bathyarchaeota archaeon]|nr:FtsX-like permease family protein [Candidatus Bathyarchaeota archaeon]